MSDTSIALKEKLLYNPKYKPTQVICGTGQVVVVTGWTPRRLIESRLEPSQYAAIGQLYSPTRGINFLVRNLLLNPHVRFLVVIEASREDENSGGCRCLIDLFKNGFQPGRSETGRDCWIVNSSVTGYVDIEIPEKVLSALTKEIICYSASTIADAIEITESLASQNPLPWREPREFPLLAQTPRVLPGHRYGHRIEGATIAEAWIKLIQLIKTTGTIRPSRYDGQWQELIDLTVVVTDEPKGFYFPQPNYLPCEPEFIDRYIGQILEDSLHQEGVRYTYGHRLRSWFKCDQIEQVITKLINEVDAASAVMSLWDVTDHEHRDTPCLNQIWVRVVEGELSLTALFRSNDMFSAWPANAMGLRALQWHIRDEIAARSDYDLAIGPLITISQSAHIYDDCWENADDLIANQYKAVCSRRSYDDPVGNFLVEVSGDVILVQRTSCGSGETIAQYQGTNPLQLIRSICADAPAIQPVHIGYLGIELEKANQALQVGGAYEQDK
jgi:thymidylate synthase